MYLICCDPTYLWFSHCKNELVHSFLSQSLVFNLADHHHEVLFAPPKGDHRLEWICDQQVLHKYEHV